MPNLKPRAFQIALVMTSISAVYMLVNRFHLYAPVQLPLSSLDRSLPLSPWAMPLYLSHFIFLPFTLLSVRSHAAYLRALKAMSLAAVVSCAVFLLYPTTYPRVESINFWFNYLNRLDTPANCFPSLHVALAAVAAWAIYEDGRPWFPLASAWCLGIVLSTILVKQHYAADALGGVAVSAVSLYLSRPVTEPLPAGEPA